MTRLRTLRAAVLAWLAVAVLRLLHCTLRVRVRGDEALHGLPGPVVFAFWHGEQQLILPSRPPGRLAVMTSRSADGQLQARILRRLGVECVSGSSSRGGASGLLALVRLVGEGAHVGVAVDGPRGPCYESKAGVIQLARLGGVPIVPVRARATRAWVVRGTWDAFVVPAPFSRLEVTFLPAIDVPTAMGRGELAVLARRLTQSLGTGLPPRGGRRPRDPDATRGEP